MGDLSDVFGEIGFDCNSVDPQQTFDPIPAGWYIAMAVEAEIKETKAMNGFYLSLQFEVLDGEYKGRKVFTNINLSNPSDAAVEIGQRALSGLGRAINVLNITDSSQVINVPLQVKVKVKSDAQYGPSNEIQGYKMIEVLAQAPLSPVATQALPSMQPAPIAPVYVAPNPHPAPPPAAPVSVPPWKR